MNKSFDTYGRPYARVSDVIEGTILIADGGFFGGKRQKGFYSSEYKDYYDILPDAELVVKFDKKHFDEDITRGKYLHEAYTSALYVDCSHGQHFLDGQYEEDDGVKFYMGLYLKKVKNED